MLVQKDLSMVLRRAALIRLSKYSNQRALASTFSVIDQRHNKQRRTALHVHSDSLQHKPPNVGLHGRVRARTATEPSGHRVTTTLNGKDCLRVVVVQQAALGTEGDCLGGRGAV